MPKTTAQTELDTARDLGRKAAQAQNDGDAARVRHWRSYFVKWRDFKQTSWTELDEAYKAAYKEARRV